MVVNVWYSHLGNDVQSEIFAIFLFFKDIERSNYSKLFLKYNFIKYLARVLGKNSILWENIDIK